MEVEAKYWTFPATSNTVKSCTEALTFLLCPTRKGLHPIRKEQWRAIPHPIVCGTPCLHSTSKLGTECTVSSAKKRGPKTSRIARSSSCRTLPVPAHAAGLSTPSRRTTLPVSTNCLHRRRMLCDVGRTVSCVHWLLNTRCTHTKLPCCAYVIKKFFFCWIIALPLSMHCCQLQATQPLLSSCCAFSQFPLPASLPEIHFSFWINTYGPLDMRKANFVVNIFWNYYQILNLLEMLFFFYVFCENSEVFPRKEVHSIDCRLLNVRGTTRYEYRQF